MEGCGWRGRKEGCKINSTALFSWIILSGKKPQNTDVYVQQNKWKQGRFLDFFSMWCARWELTLCTQWKKCTKGLITQAIANQSSHSWMRVKTKLSCSKKYVKSILTTDSRSKSLFRDSLHNPPPFQPSPSTPPDPIQMLFLKGFSVQWGMAGSAPADPTKEGTGEAGFMPSWKSHLSAEGWAVLCHSCESQQGHRHGTNDTLEGLWWLLWASHKGEEAQSAPANPRPQPPPFPVMVPDHLFWVPAPDCKSKCLC